MLSNAKQIDRYKLDVHESHDSVEPTYKTAEARASQVEAKVHADRRRPKEQEEDMEACLLVESHTQWMRQTVCLITSFDKHLSTAGLWHSQ